MKVLGSYNQQLSAALARAEQQWPALCTEADPEPTEQEVEEQRRTLLLAMIYLDQLQRLLGHPALADALHQERRPALSAPEKARDPTS